LVIKNNITSELDEIELIPNGKKIYINNENKYFFLEKFVEYYTYLRHKEKVDSILKGFNSLIPSDKLNIFSVEEFDLLLSGQIQIDVTDWKTNTEYIGYSPNDNIIKWFWDSLLNLKPFQLKIFFTFCTGMARAPLNGFRVLQTSRNQIVKFCIEKVYNNNDLIQAKTCFNKILLPCYESYEKMKENIYKIVNNDTNFLGRK
jgi:E3 ubiquitin-protein ligase NEDD4